MEKKFNIEVKIVIADFKDCLEHPKIFDEIFDQVKELDISILINNVGVLYLNHFG